jgi:RHS repeat-associated protein
VSGLQGQAHTTSITGGATENQTLTWTDQDKLATDVTSNGTTSYVYDTSGNLILRRDPGQTTFFFGDEQLALNTSTGTVSGTRYYTIGGITIALRVGGGNAQYLIPDRQGTDQMAIDSSTEAITRRQYLPFGQIRGAAPAWPGDSGYVGGVPDPSTNLENLGAREYDPISGRFLSVDPVFETNDPRQMGGYSYAGNDPTTESDSSGLMLPGGAECGIMPDDPCVGSIGGGGGGQNNNGGATENAPSAASTVATIPPGVPSVPSWRPHSKPIASPPEAVPDQNWKYENLGSSNPCAASETFGLCLLWDFSAIPDIVNCALKGSVGSCASAAISIIPPGRVLKGFSAISDLVRAATETDRAARVAVAAESGAADVAANAANGVRLAQQLSYEGFTSAFTASGELQPALIASAQEIVAGSKLGNTRVVQELTADGSSISDWAKFTTGQLGGPGGMTFQVHFYMNRVTNKVNCNWTGCL